MKLGPGTVVINGTPYQFTEATVTTTPKKVYSACDVFRSGYDLAASLFSRLRVTEPIRNTGPIIKRNAPCRCGSGLKWKRCCGVRS